MSAAPSHDHMSIGKLRVLVFDAGTFAPPDWSLRAGLFSTRMAVAVARAEVSPSLVAVRLFSGVEWGFAIQNWRQMLGRHEWHHEGIPVEYLGVLAAPFAKPLRRGLARCVVPRMLDAWLDRHGEPHLAHVHWGWTEVSQSAMEHLRRRRIPYVLTEHSSLTLRHADLPAIQRERYARHARNAEAVSAVGLELAQALSAMSGVAEVDITPNSVDDIFLPRSTPLEDGELVRLVTVGVSAPKRIDRLIEAVSAVRWRCRRCRLTVVSGDPIEALNRPITIASDAVEIVTRRVASPNELRSLFQEADAYVCASDFETFGVAPLEAASCGAALLTVECGVPARAAQLGLGISTPRNTAALRDGIEHFLSDLSGWRRSRDARAELARLRFGSEHVGHQTAQFLTRAYERSLR